MSKHPNRYPKHKGDKGQTHGGTCNVTACNTSGAVYWNMMTHGFYCRRCANGINWRHVIVCIEVDEKPSVQDMDKMKLNEVRSKYEKRGAHQ